MKKFYLLLLLALLTSTSYGQSIVWEDVNQYFEYIINLQRTNDQQIAGSGIKSSSTDYYRRFVKYDLDGNLIWQTPGRIIKGGPTPLVPLANGNFFLGGYSPTGTIGPFEVNTFIQQLDPNGDTLATGARTFVTPDTLDWVTNILKLNEDTFLLSGYSQDLNDNPEYFLRKIDISGNTIWQKYYAKELNAYGTYTIRNRNNEFILFGTSSRPSQFTLSIHPYLVKVSASGNNIQESKVVVFDSTRCETTRIGINTIAEANNGDYIFSGTVDDCGSGVRRGYVARVDSAFNLVWGYEHMQQTGTSYATSKVVELEDGSILLLASDNPVMPAGFYLIRISATGQFISQTTLQSQACPDSKVGPDNWLFLPDSSIVISGKCWSNNQGYIGRWKVPGLPTILHDTTLVSAAEPVLTHSSLLGFAFPNPAENTVTVPYTIPAGTNAATLRIAEVATGRVVREVTLNLQAEQVQLELEQFSSGLYTYSLLLNGVPSATKKLVVIK